MGAKLTNQQFLDRAIKVHGNKYTYLSEYVTAKIKIKINCPEHGVFAQQAASHLSGSGCAKCNFLESASKRTKSNEQFTYEANFIHNNKYEYIDQYVGVFVKMKIKCPIHGIFLQTPTDHLNSYGCMNCGNIIAGLNHRKNNNQFIIEAKLIHGDKYSYLEANCSLVKNKILIICNNCNCRFYQTPDNHLSGNGCPQCANEIKALAKRKPISIFILDAIKIHGDKYDYSNIVFYKNGNTKLPIKCVKCDLIFNQSAANHLSGNGCPFCSHLISKGESDWLDSLSIAKEYRQYHIKIGKKTISADAYDPNINTVYEYYGDYWHGNPIKYNAGEFNQYTKCIFGVLYKKTMDREALIKQAGYKIVSIWESEWKNEQKRIKKDT